MTDELVCKRCQPLESVVIHQERALQAMQAQVDELLGDVAALRGQLMRSGRAEQALRRELEKRSEDEPQADLIKALLNLWRTRLGHPKARIPLSGSRASVVRKALRVHRPDEIQEAINGMALYPYVGPQGRAPTGKPRDRHDRIEIALADETSVERFARYYRQTASPDALDWVFEAWQETSALQRMWLETFITNYERVENAQAATD